MRIFAIVVASLVLSACSQGSLDRLTNALNRFDTAVERVDASIAKTSATLAKYCGDAETIGVAFEPLVDENQKARAGLAAVNAGIRSWCQRPPENTASAIASMAKVVADGKAAYKAAKAAGR